MNDPNNAEEAAMQSFIDAEDAAIFRILESYCFDCNELTDIGVLAGCKTCIARSVIES